MKYPDTTTNNRDFNPGYLKLNKTRISAQSNQNVSEDVHKKQSREARSFLGKAFSKIGKRKYQKKLFLRLIE